MVTTRIVQRLTRLTPFPDAIGCLDARVSAVAPRPIAAGAALGRTLAAPVFATETFPLTALALRDGWAVNAEATLDAGSYAPAVLPQVPPAIEVGNRLPANADAVAPIDAVELCGAMANALVTVAPGEGVLPRGADTMSGEPLFQSGRRMSRTDLALLKAFGPSIVSVREPRIQIAPARTGVDCVIDGIVALLCEAVVTEGGVGFRAEPASADPDALDGILVGEEADAIIIVGGSGAGERDHSVHALTRLGRCDFHGVGLVPGETTAFGIVGSRPVLVMPGRFDAALAAWLTLGRRMLALMCARSPDDPASPAILTRKVTSTVGFAEVIVARWNDKDGEIVPLGSEYLSARALAAADGWFLVPAEAEGYPAGTSIALRLLP